jgi:FkbM family methyltransferase
VLPPGNLQQFWPMGLQRTFRLLMTSGLRDFLVSPVAKEIESAMDGTLAEAPAWTLPCRMLIERSFEHPIADGLDVPGWINDDYLDFLFEPIEVLNKIGDAERAVDYLARLTDVIHRLAAGRPSAGRRDLCNAYVSRASLIPCYFSERNLSIIYRQRGDLISTAVISSGVRTLHAINPRRRATVKIRLGIFARHFGPLTETYFTLSHFEHLDRAAFEIALYCLDLRQHPLEKKCTTYADRIVPLPPNDLAAQVRRLREDDLDILVISTNMTASAESAALLGSCRMAPIQIATVSSPVTTGCRHTDVLLSAEWNEPAADARDHYTEHLELMPDSLNYYAYLHDTDPATVSPSRASLGLDPDTLVMFSGANFFKITPELSRTWTRILAAVPNSILMLMPFNPNWTRKYRRLPFVMRIQQQMREAGVDPSRLRIVDPVPARADVHRVLGLADMYLDAHPFAGACSMLDPIIVGVPPVVWTGDTGRSSHGASLMRMVGFDELVCHTEDEYVTAAVAMATDASKRKRIRDALLALAEREPPIYFDTAVFSQRVGEALLRLQKQQRERYDGIALLSVAERRERLRVLAQSLVGKNFELNQLTDTGIVNILIDPFFRSLGATTGSRRVVDVGACIGAMSLPMIQRGWEAELFEPDPEARSALLRNVASAGARCRVHAVAVSNTSVGEVSFHKSSTVGCSGFEASPFSATQTVIKVPCTTLAKFCAERDITAIDFLKIDAEGFDFEVLEAHDLDAVATRLILVEYGTHFPRQTLDIINSAVARMAAHGYGAIVFNYVEEGNFMLGDWRYRLTEMLIDEPIPSLGRNMFGNILFYRNNDTDFVLTMFALLNTCRRPTDVWCN